MTLLGLRSLGIPTTESLELPGCLYDCTQRRIDHAVTYVLDSNFMEFVGAHRDLFPGYFMEALKVRTTMA
jgi:hypothetical protein